ncbi:MAG TPA: SurA N-terminal domain-containing protein [Gaiellaceae bacterium]|nr:SurA N-terminal domain-containing protein [Gaiellaceae bacterium]
MKATRPITLFAVAIAAAALAAGCGNERQSVGANDVAVVGDQTISKDQFDRLMEQARRNYEANKQQWPDTGTPQYVALRKQAMQFLVQRAEFEQKASDLGLNITDSDVDKQFTTIKSQYFGKGGQCDSTCEQKFQAELKKQRLTVDQVRDDVRAQVVQNKLYDKVTANVQVSDKDVGDYYKQNKAQYVQPASRDVRRILVKKKALADQVYQQVTNGGNFAALAKKYSTDVSSKDTGGKLTIAKGRQDPVFDNVAFTLKAHQIAKPFKDSNGWEVLQALTPTKKQSVTKLSEVQTAIRQQLLGQKKQDAMRKWVDDTTKDFESKTAYQVGYEPPKAQSSTTSTAQQ